MIEIKNNITKEDLDWIDEQEYIYESKHNLKDDRYEDFIITYKENDIIVGMLKGYTCFDDVYLDELVVKEEFRCKGIGKKLVLTAENLYRSKDFYDICLVTHGYQAPEFYKKLGYELTNVRVNKRNPDLTKYYFIKYY